VIIIVHYESIDSYGRVKTRSFKSLKGAQKYAHDWIGPCPSLGGYYAVSDDGVGKITVSGDATLAELFPEAV
jgi:hypothetical protein